MASPQARYQPQDYFSPAQPQSRSRSSSAAERYSPRAYNYPPQPVPNQQYLAPNNYPQSPPAGTPGRHEAPYPVEDPHAAPHTNMPVAQRPLAQQAMIHSGQHTDEMFPMDGYQDQGYRRPSYHGEDYRRPSYSGSAHERRPSHHSDRSHRSHHSHHHDRDRNDSDDDDYEEDRHHHHHHHQRHRSKSDISDLETYRQRQKDRGENVSRSFGDSLLSVMSPLKYLLEPRDKY